MIPELKDVLFVDIETVAATDNFSTMDERLKTQWSRKATYLKRNTEQTDEELFHERAGIYAEFGKIICVAVGKFVEHDGAGFVFRTKAFYGDDEKALLLDFKNTLEKTDQSTLRLCAHNGREFDFPYLCRRLLVNDIPLPIVLNISGRKSWEIPHMDTMDMWKFGDYKHYTSLDLLTALFNVASSKEGMDGSQVNAVYYRDKNLTGIKDYCLRDIVALAKVYMKLKAIPIPETFSVQHTS